MFASRSLCLLGLTIIGLSFSSAALADTPAYTIANTEGGLLSTGNTSGFQFTTNAPVIVTQLGVFDSDGDGLAESHTVGIWTSSGTLLVSATIPSGTGAALTNQFRYVAVTPTFLAAGQSYEIGSYPDFSDPSVAGTSSFATSGFATVPSITFVENRVIGGFGNPTVTNAVLGTGIFGPNFQFTTVPPGTPIPSSALLVGLGGAILLVYEWRRRRLQATEGRKE